MTCDEVFTAPQIASALQRSKRSVLTALVDTAPAGMRLVSGNPARMWRLEQLPQRMRTELENAAARQQLNVAMFVASPPLRWQPKYPASECSEDAVARASLLQRALAPSLQANVGQQFESRADFEAAGVEK
jgi:hypothetical protein